uniref:Peptidoglycan-recognition protein SC2-like isoform X2 n=1 Tax=Crassostrea virginica TaxID=6565 RepID=A0A8B8ACG4_CRAVI|nr:peptidoglycan-recognition protein SC2-like isoform X2 [Crassostrea virginica]
MMWKTIVCLALLVPLASGNDAPCTAIGGTCQDDSMSCSGGYESGFCGGGVNRRCCKQEDATCVSIGGTCQDDSLSCSGGYESGLCGGGVNRKCCKVCSGVKIYSRASWGAKAPKSSTIMSTPVSLFFVHHTVGSSCNDFTSCAAVMRSIQNYHMDIKGWSDIGYSFLVGEDGAVYEGRGWNKVGAHTQGYNSRGLAASVMGNFMNRKPNTAALNAMKNLIQCGISRGYITSTYKLYGHRDVVSTTTCPGDALYQEIKTWPHYSTQTP